MEAGKRGAHVSVKDVCFVCFVFSCCAVHFRKEILISCVCVCLVGSHQLRLGILLTLPHCKLIRLQSSEQGECSSRGARVQRRMLSRAPWHDSLPKGSEKEVKTEELAWRDLEIHIGCWRVPRFKAELVFLVSGERIAVLVVLVASMPLYLGSC